MTDPISRRTWLSAAAAGGLAAGTTHAQAADPPPAAAFGFCLNTSTVRTADGKSRPVTELVDVAAKAGYQAIEPWTSELAEYTKGGGSLKELAKRIADAGLVVPDAIGFAEWIVEDPERRKKGLEQARRDTPPPRIVLASPPDGLLTNRFRNRAKTSWSLGLRMLPWMYAERRPH